MKRVTVPIEKSTFREIPCARTVQGDAPVSDKSNKPYTRPNKIKQKQRNKKVDNLLAIAAKERDNLI